MPRTRTATEKLAVSLEAANMAQIDGIVRSGRISRKHQERLEETGFLREIIRGWYYLLNPEASAGTTAWYGHFWSFVRQYLRDRFDDAYCLRPEPSLQLHAGSTIIPRQLIVIRSDPGQAVLNLPYGTSLIIHQDRNSYPVEATEINGLRVMDLAEAFVRAPTAFYQGFPEDATICLKTIRDPGVILRLLLERNLRTAAGRIAGGFRHVGMPAHADRIVKAMKSAGLDVREANPFDQRVPVLLARNSARSPYVDRIRHRWGNMREVVMTVFPPRTGPVEDTEGYLKKMDEIYVQDAYHSLSIEGYQVTPELIERIRSGQWNPDSELSDRDARNAFAARGYLEAFRAVKHHVAEVLGGADAAKIVRQVHHDWHQAMFSVEVQSGLLSPAALAGYRHNPVFIRDSRHVPLPEHALLDVMETLFDLLEEEPEPAVRAVLGHFIFVFIHPYQDGNGRMARFLMNLMFASGGFPWTVIRREHRDQYFAALEAASVESDIGPFSRLVLDEMRADVSGNG